MFEYALLKTYPTSSLIPQQDMRSSLCCNRALLFLPWYSMCSLLLDSIDGREASAMTLCVHSMTSASLSIEGLLLTFCSHVE